MRVSFPSHEEKGWKGIEGRRNTIYSGTEVGKDVVGLTESPLWVKKQGRKKRDGRKKEYGQAEAKFVEISVALLRNLSFICLGACKDG